ncbi:MAG: hypothetical protein AABZ77_02475 [Chloroflexota bacterium]
MPKKPVTWIGAIIILGAGIYCFSGLFQYRSKLPASSTQVPLVTGAAFLALVLAIGAIFFWYYLNEKQGGGGKGPGSGDSGLGTGDRPGAGDQGPGTKPQL